MKLKFLHTLKTLIFAGSFLAATSISSFAAEYVSVTKDGANVRTGPSTSDPVYMELFQGYPLQIVEKKGDWMKIQDYEKDSGWIHNSLTGNRQTVIVSAESSANMRSGAGTQNGVIANLERGVVLDLIERKDNWAHVKHQSGTEGWIYAPLLWP